MPASPIPGNPFDPTVPNAPFVGRDALFARVHQHLTGAPVTQALLMLGRRRSGRTAFLRALRARFDESFIWVDLALTPVSLSVEAAFWRTVWDGCKAAAAGRGLSVHRLPHWPDDKPASYQREWLTERGLPELYQLIRPHRRLVLLMDNAESLADAVSREDLPADLGEALGAMFGTQLGMVITAHLDAEGRMRALAPLVTPDSTVRLNALTAAEVADLLTAGRDGAEDNYAQALHRATGGAPELTLRAAALVHDHARGESYRAEHLRAVAPDLLLWSRPGFALMWENFTSDEQAVLTALAYLHFAHPDRALQAEQVEAWLADTEYPLDLTAIFSLLRRLDFVEVVDHAHRDVKIRAGLFEQWIRETVRPNHLRRAELPSSSAPIDPKIVRYALIGLGVVALLLVVLIALGAPSPSGGEAVPTVVLGG
ncbi:MAG: hypothetical protein MUF38_13410 [Anaerolineae bacterium]|jgi:hypothetical protein|nr:hypothetical protein [Anaerolineae bacterium]